MTEPIVNKVKQNTKLVNLDLQQFCPDIEIIEFDVKDCLIQGFLLKESEFRTYLEEHDWSAYEGKAIAVYCSTDAIIPPWAYMLITTAAKEYTADVYFGTSEKVREALFLKNLQNHDWSAYDDKFVMVKGCSDIHVPESIYANAAFNLYDHASKIMYGEACSNVPVWRKAKK